MTFFGFGRGDSCFSNTTRLAPAAFMEANLEKGREEREGNINGVKTAIENVLAHEKPLSYDAIATELGWTVRRIRHYINSHDELEEYRKRIENAYQSIYRTKKTRR